MIIRKTWTKNKGLWQINKYTGYFLFGFIPLYIKRETFNKY